MLQRQRWRADCKLASIGSKGVSLCEKDRSILLVFPTRIIERPLKLFYG
jgi:hypothetical protein